MSEAEESSATLERRLLKNRPAIIVAFVLFVLSALGQLYVAGRSAHDWWHDRFEWRELEYARLTALQPEYTVEKFKQVLGPEVSRRVVSIQDEPFSVNPSSGAALSGTDPDVEEPGRGELVERLYQGRDWWAQSLADSEGRVLYYAVTSCSSDFQPSFVLPGLDVITLQVSSMAQANHAPASAAVLRDVSHSSYIESRNGSSQTHGNTFLLASTQACQNARDSSAEGVPPDTFENGLDWTQAVEFDAEIEALRDRVTVNTVAECSDELPGGCEAVGRRLGTPGPDPAYTDRSVSTQIRRELARG